MTEFGLPQNLSDGLVLRWATTEDIEQVAQFNIRIHSDDPENPETSLGVWTRDLMKGIHPTTKASDFTVVVDENEGGKIVSSLCLISQEWAYDGIAFKVGRPELVGTDEAYRKRGLVRAQMDVVHAKSEARAELVQGITGIPWYYRMFEYEMGLDLGGSRMFVWQRMGNYKPLDPEPYKLRPAIRADIPTLKTLFEANNQGSLVTRRRSDAEWQYELEDAQRESIGACHFYMVETAVTGDVVAYVEYQKWGARFAVREIGVKPGISWRPICLFITRALKKEADRHNESNDKKVEYMIFNLGVNHSAYQALGSQLEKQNDPYAWYIRVPDVRAFLQKIAPVLERRLAASVLVGHTGLLQLNFYRDHVQLTFEDGKLVEIGSYAPTSLTDGNAKFPELTFLHLLFGHRSYDELHAAYADFYAKDAETAVLLNILFPKQHSWVADLG
ncbi:MAG: GNAT family N-acetyltransferase [Chloroflexi bacterium]|nr:GNAT family N-acetyltransferase [Chloroflexota bacterium]